MITALSIHARYACRHAGACCTSGWEIPVEAALTERLEAALSGGDLLPPPDGGTGTARPLVRRVGLPPGCGAALGTDAAGRCLFYEQDTGLCGIQRQRGHDWLPSACRHFPRVVLMDDRGTSITLSHYCPTAARTLVREDVALEIVDSPPAFPAEGDWEGLDARGALPPLLAPDVLMDLASYAAWERHVVGVFAREDLSPDAALARLRGDAERLRTWRPGDGTLTGRVAEVAARRDRPTIEKAGMTPPQVDLFELARAAVPPPLASLPPPADLATAWAHWVEPAWRSAWRPVRRYLAAKGFGTWVAYQGRGLRTVVRSIEAALSVVKVEAARAAGRSARPLDEALLVEAFRAADLLLVHLASREALARCYSAAED